MKNKKGFTLIEVIVSIAIIGILAVSFLPSITNYFKWIIETKTKITQDTFTAQKIIEENINNIRKAMIEKDIELDEYDSLGITKKIKNIHLFKDDFKGYPQRKLPSAYETKVTVGNEERLVALVGDKRLPELPVPTIEILSLNFLKNNNKLETKVEYFDYPNLQLQAISNMSKNPQNSFNRYRHEWFVSNPGFNIPIPGIGYIDEDFDMGRIYPKFPEDYEAIPIFTELSNVYEFRNQDERIITGILKNNIVKKYPGRHILYTITPYAKSLKKGTTSTRLPLFVSGPNITKSLKVHLDTSTILKGDSIIKTELREEDEMIYFLEKWKNNIPSFESPNSSYDAVSTNEMPMFKSDVLLDEDLEVLLDMEINFQKDSDKKVIGRALQSNLNTISNMQIKDIELGNNWTIFIIMRKDQASSLMELNKPILSGLGHQLAEHTRWALKWTVEGKISFEGESDGNSNSVELSNKLKDDWYLMEISKNETKTKIKGSNLKENSNEPSDDESIEIIYGKSRGIDINWNGVEIAEILVYDSEISQAEIEKYLIDKYKGR